VGPASPAGMDGHIAVASELAVSQVVQYKDSYRLCSSAGLKAVAQAFLKDRPKPNRKFRFDQDFWYCSELRKIKTTL